LRTPRLLRGGGRTEAIGPGNGSKTSNDGCWNRDPLSGSKFSNQVVGGKKRSGSNQPIRTKEGSPHECYLARSSRVGVEAGGRRVLWLRRPGGRHGSLFRRPALARRAAADAARPHAPEPAPERRAVRADRGGERHGAGCVRLPPERGPGGGRRGRDGGG